MPPQRASHALNTGFAVARAMLVCVWSIRLGDVDIQGVEGAAGERRHTFNQTGPMMSTIERAIEIAARHHAGDTDKAGSPYLYHPLRLMFAVNSLSEKMAAVLHDVVEDTPVTLEELRQEGFPEEVVEAVDALTKRPGESRLEAAARAAANPVARVVKLADVTDNMDLSRISDPTDKDFERLKEYVKVKKLLLKACATSD